MFFGYLGRLWRKDDPLPFIWLAGFVVFCAYFLVASNPDRFSAPDVRARHYLQEARVAIEKGRIDEARAHLGSFNMIDSKVTLNGRESMRQKLRDLHADADALKAQL